MGFGFYNETMNPDEISVTGCELALSRRPEAAEWKPVLQQMKHSFAVLTPVGPFDSPADLE